MQAIRRLLADGSSALFKLLLLICSVFILVAGSIIWFVPPQRIPKNLPADQKIKLENEIRNSYKDAFYSLSQMLGGLVVIIGAYNAWLTTRRQEMERGRQSFTAAVQLVENQDEGVRHQAVNDLIYMAREIPQLELEIMQRLVRYVQTYAPKFKPNDDEEIQKRQDRAAPVLNEDIQKCLSAIGYRSRALEHRGGLRLDFSGCDLRKADLRNAYLKRGDFTDASLALADLRGAELGHAKLIRTRLFAAQLIRADLDDADLTEAILDEAECTEAEMKRAKLINARLRGAILRKAELQGAELTDADFTDANLRYAQLEGANWEGAKNTTSEQFSRAYRSQIRRP